MKEINIAFLSLGTNLGNKVLNLKKIVKAFEDDSQIEILKKSSVFETSPVGGVEQDNFYNMAIKICTTYSPNELLEVIHLIEKNLKRVRKIRWGPRTADIDILTFNNQKISTASLKIPHPEMLHRLFVLEPLLEITHSAFYSYEELKQAESEILQNGNQEIINKGALR